MNGRHSSTVDADVEALIRESWLNRQVERIGRTGNAAWRNSRARRAATRLAAAFARGSIRASVQDVAIVTGVGMLVHLALVFAGARSIEPSALLLPLVILAAAVAAYAGADRLARVAERRG